jgi:hypothetical protein
MDLRRSYARSALAALALAALILLVLLLRMYRGDGQGLPPRFEDSRSSLQETSPPLSPTQSEEAVPGQRATDPDTGRSSKDPDRVAADDRAVLLIRKLEETPKNDVLALGHLIVVLSDTGSTIAVDWLLGYLQNLPISWDAAQTDSFRNLIAQELGNLGDPRSIPALQSLSTMVAASHLVEDEEGAKVERRSTFPQMARASIQQIEYLGRLARAVTEDERIEVHLDQLLRQDAVVDFCVLGLKVRPNQSLPRIGDRAVPIMLQRISRAAPEERVHLLMYVGGAEFEPVLRSHPEAYRAVEKVALAEALRASNDTSATLAALQMLGKFSEDQEILQAVRAFSDSTRGLLAGAGRGGTDQTLANLHGHASAAADRIEFRLRVRAKTETERIPDYYWALDRASLESAAEFQLIKAGEGASRYLLDRVKSGAIDLVRVPSTVNVLSSIYRQKNGDANSLVALLHLARHSDPDVVWQATMALGNTWSAEALEVVRELRGTLESANGSLELSTTERLLFSAATEAERKITEEITRRNDETSG